MYLEQGACLEKFESTDNLNKQRENKLRDNQQKKAFKEIILCLLFVALSMTCSFQMIDSNSFQYRQNLMNLFGAGNINTAFNKVCNRKLLRKTKKTKKKTLLSYLFADIDFSLE